MDKGFSLIEIIVVMAIFSCFILIITGINIGSYKRYSFHNERDRFISFLFRARSQSINDVCYGICDSPKDHGIHLETNQYTFFQGTVYVLNDPQNEIVDINPNLNIEGPVDIIFLHSSGEVITTPLASSTIKIFDSMKNSIITVNKEGGISWTN
jgi:prepilin-type N-terminal cleavage/methylation domain-containing protein